MQFLAKTAGLAAAMAVFVGGAAQASPLQVKVPFAFSVHGQTLPAGLYRLDSTGPVLSIQGEGANHAAMFVMGTPASGTDPNGEQPVVTFTRYENQYRLADVWNSRTDGWAMSPTAFAAAAGQSATSTGKKSTKSDHVTTGTVKSMDDKTLVLTRNNKKHSEMTFELAPSVARQGTVAVGSKVSIRYHEDGSRHMASAITAQPKA